MSYEDPSYLGGSLAKTASETNMVRMPTLRERIDLSVRQAEERLVAAKRAKELFDRNPDLEELLNIMQKGNF